MASKGRWSLRQSDWEYIYWSHSLAREERLNPGLPQSERVTRASQRAREVTKRYKRARKRLGLSTEVSQYRRAAKAKRISCT